MKSKIGAVLMTCALTFGMASMASAQIRNWGRHGRSVTVYPNGRRVYRQPDGDKLIIRPNGRRVFRDADRNNGRHYGWTNRARTYRLPNGRIVTVLPNGRRIYR